MHQLAAKLGDLLNHPPSSVELLPGDGSEWFAEGSPPEVLQHAPFLFVEGNLGVPHKLAYKLYLQSVPTFQACRSRLRVQTDDSGGSSPDSHSRHAHILTDTEVKNTLASSAVLLLVNPAHQSALNARKRLVQCGALDAGHELRVVSALLTLRDGAKQSILWHHRRWLLRRVHTSLPSPPDDPQSRHRPLGEGPRGDGEDSLWNLDLDAGWFRAEFAVVSQACETYPRNYHAWAHRFLCAQALVAVVGHPSTSDAHRSEVLEVWREERRRVREWIDRHVSDYSAMQYACRLEVLGDGLRPSMDEKSSGTLPPVDGSLEAPLSEHAWLLVESYPAYESLWLYFRGALQHPSNEDMAVSDSPPVQAIPVEAQNFVERLLSDETADDTSNILPGELALVRNHAVRFRAWVLWKEKRVQLNAGFVRRVAMAAEDFEPASSLEATSIG
ncbi:hypothetical protein BN946_scf184403.g14 [Trametes cinnabarina]|uniref:Uncharacterized protein n=1 Tax=Pycnoporus cinnabarinus TaxID=5643 RepID=A0A060SXQ7_PYCCI|nr:hypothetical protein BN946_scf184403.g14 [Trametes cinnabarina]